MIRPKTNLIPDTHPRRLPLSTESEGVTQPEWRNRERGGGSRFEEVPDGHDDQLPALSDAGPGNRFRTGGRLSTMPSLQMVDDNGGFIH